MAFYKNISQWYRAREPELVRQLAQQAVLPKEQRDSVYRRAYRLIEQVRLCQTGGLDAFMKKYDLSSDEGIALMCLAESLLRVPDKATVNQLIEDKICAGRWKSHLDEKESLFVNAMTWSLMLTGKILTPMADGKNFSQTLQKFLQKNAQPLIRQSIFQAMRILGHQFVLGETINTAQNNAKKFEAQGYRFSYDMLGEAAMTDKDAQRYWQAYLDAINAIGKNTADTSDTAVFKNAGISIKLSALSPRYGLHQIDDVNTRLYPRLYKLAMACAQFNINMTIDAEESERLEMSLLLLERLCKEKSLIKWQGLGLAVQAYQKRATAVIDALAMLAHQHQRRLMVRLVKGAYWDSEIKQAQLLGVDDYPVFTQKMYSDLSYQVCAQKLLADSAAFYPQFATHNAQSLAVVLELAEAYNQHDFEFQCLHGMGAQLYDHIVSDTSLKIPCRIYAPVGTHKHLLAYLVRRLLENGANSSFINRIAHASVPIDSLVVDPVEAAQASNYQSNPAIPLPRAIYANARMGAHAFDLFDQSTLDELTLKIHAVFQKTHTATPLLASALPTTAVADFVTNPANGKTIGKVTSMPIKAVKVAIGDAIVAQKLWGLTDVRHRAQCLYDFADQLEANAPRFMALAIQEAGKTLVNAQGEVREAVDFCRYYANLAVAQLMPQTLKGPTGEDNIISYHGRGAMVCISPWNFPLAIFLGGITAALVTGNSVLAKPAAQTPIIASEAIKLLHQVGVPPAVVQLLVGDKAVGNALVSDKRIAGVIFTGSTQTSTIINTTLSQHAPPIVPLIAETGGINAMIVDSSALPEQVTSDVIYSAFDSAGQRCSALRVLYVQDDIADALLAMIKGAMDELVVGDPAQISTDIGPIIDQAAQSQLLAHINALKALGYPCHQTALPECAIKGTFIAPTLCEIPNLSVLRTEQFGPVLHVIRYRANRLDGVVDDINQLGYGLTFGIHSRIQKTIDQVCQRIQCGNVYVNRNVVGAVVGVQPFGGQGLSGTGPKAGGPHYLKRLIHEKVTSVNTAAIGGNAQLMGLGAEKKGEGNT